MRTHSSSLTLRLIRAALRVSSCRYRVAAAGFNSRNQIIGIATNAPRLSTRGWHAEERLIYRSPRSLARIEIVRVGAEGQLLPIDPCEHCLKIARNRGIEIRRHGVRRHAG